MAETSLSSSSDSGRSAPLLTVAMPIYNAGRHLRLAVLSIVRQSVKNWELLIIDDGSTDNALQSIQDIQDSRIYVLRDGLNKGLAARLNEAIDMARGHYFARMDQDDISFPERLARQLEVLEQHPEIDLVSVRCITMDADNTVVGALPFSLAHAKICDKPWRGFYLPHPTWMGRIEWFRHHRYASPGPFFCEDQELLLRTYTASRFATVDEVLFAYRVRPGINWKKQRKTRWTLFGIQFRRFLDVRQYHFAVLSSLVFVGRIAQDVIALGKQKIGKPAYPLIALDSAEVAKWQAVLDEALRMPESGVEI